MDQTKNIRLQSIATKRRYLLDNGWEANGQQAPYERWRRRSFDNLSEWVSFTEAIKRQKEWDNFWVR